MDDIFYHHRSLVKKNHKGFKSKHATKSSLKVKNKGKVEKPTSVSRKMHSISKKDRRNQAKQVLLNKRDRALETKKLFEGRRGVARVVAVVPLCEDVSAAEVVRALLASVDVEAAVPATGTVSVSIERYKQKVQFLVLPRDFVTILDAAQVADFVVFGLSAVQEVDEYGETALRAIIGQGVSTVSAVVQHLDEVAPAKMQAEVRKSLLSYVGHFFPTEEKVFAQNQRQDCLNAMRNLCQQFPRGVQWRDARPYLLADAVAADAESGCVVVRGTVRGRAFNPDRLVHLPGYGDFAVARVVVQDDDAGDMAVDAAVLEPGADADGMDELAPPPDEAEAEYAEPGLARGVRLDDHFYLSDDDDERAAKTLDEKHRIPRGMSTYQARWIIDENSDDEFAGSSDDGSDDAMSDVAPSAAPTAMDYQTEYDGQSEMFVDLPEEEEARQLKAYRERERDDAEFPDEVEIHPDVSAKERYARYRGLKSLRTSEWDVDEADVRTPAEWGRLSRFGNYRATRNRVFKEAAAPSAAGVGARVLIYVRAPPAVAAGFGARTVYPVYGLLRHEHKKVVLNVAVTPNTEYEDPIPSKDDLIMQVGPRRYNVNPLFAEAGKTPNNVYKLERFLHQGRASIATVIAPVSFGNTPVIFLKQKPDGLRLVGAGTVLDTDHSRVLAKRIIFTGYPYKIHKRVVTVRYMFFNHDDVAWFKAVPLFTKMGRTGYVKESIGTHGYFKCTFDGPLNAQDTIAMSLYKRVWPRVAAPWQGEPELADKAW
ncbi:uncharacterized protein V1510DRAFT_429713 [Dipodascopsis tothii]|uniref:uncharacterized protein n=1 Tax=Dipodascopsis tothii TaxID=44089 RepID=UPI0034CD6448